jgi:predicted metal-dependent hydrolase
MATRKRQPQLALRLDAEAPDAAAHWRDGSPLVFLGRTVLLKLDTHCKEADLADGELHLPLPPEAKPRQVQDAAESWLRAQALRVISLQAAMAARQFGRPVPAVSLTFASRANWVLADGGSHGLRCHWRLVEQPPEVIADVVAKAVAGLPRAEETLDLFAVA